MGLNARQAITIKPKLFLVGICLGLGLALAACSLFWRKDAEKVVQAFPVFPGAVEVGRYDPTWPDSKSLVGLAYTSEASTQELIDFFKTEPAEQGWQLDEVIEYDSPAAITTLLWENEDWNCRVLIYPQEPRRIEIEISPK